MVLLYSTCLDREGERERKRTSMRQNGRARESKRVRERAQERERERDGESHKFIGYHTQPAKCLNVEKQRMVVHTTSQVLIM